MTGGLRAPRVEGHFEGDAMRAWDVRVGQRGSADIVDRERLRRSSKNGA